MPQELLLAIGFVTSLCLWLAIKHAIAAHQYEAQLRIARSGATSLGKVVAIQRPFMLDDCTRLYFDFLPSGAEHPVRACHVARTNDEGALRTLPTNGATVTVRYLPDRPRHAVIGALVMG